MKMSHRNALRSASSISRFARDRKGMELSINMLVIVAMAIFVLFLVVGFVLGGFSYFKGIFGKVATSPGQVAETKCSVDLQSYVNQYGRTGAGIGTRLGDKICEQRTDAGDLDGNGAEGDSYSCGEYINVDDICSGAGIPPPGGDGNGLN